MNKLSKKAFEEIRLWVYRNARHLELALWKYHFENGSKEDVIVALSFYQNKDGGFGNGLEPDSWNPNSSPYTTLYAIGILNEINAIDTNQPMVQEILKYFDSGVNSDESGWYFNIPSNDLHAHAPWWTYDKKANEYESLGVTAGIVEFILRYASKDSRLYMRALSLAEKLIQKLEVQGNFGEMGVQGYCKLKDMIMLLDRTDQYDMNVINHTVCELVNTSIERDSSKWCYHCKTPRDFITSPNSEFYKDNVDITEAELDYIIDTRPEQGVWGITWSWFDNNDKYPKEFAISENWWKSCKAISTLLHLRDFQRIELQDI